MIGHPSRASSPLHLHNPWLDPPAQVRARGLILGEGDGAFHIIAPESALTEHARLMQALNGARKDRTYQVRTLAEGECISAVPGAYALPVVIESSLLQREEIALATEQPGHYRRVSGGKLGTIYLDTRIAAFAEPVGIEPTAHEKAGDDADIAASISRFTERRLQQRLDQTLQIPPLPEAARRIIALHADPNYPLKDLVTIVENDPAMAARILGWANSAFYQASPPAASINDAIVRILGVDTVMSMALGLAVGDTLRLPEAQVTGLPPYWLDAIYTAATMEALVRQMPVQHRPRSGLCYLAGLLANFGTLVVGHVFVPQYRQICLLQELNRHLAHTHVDAHVLGVQREVLASTLLEGWDLPGEITDAIRFQHLNDYAGANATYVNLLRLARQTLGNQGITDVPAIGLQEIQEPATLGLNIDNLKTVEKLIEQSREDLDGLAAAM